jgi:hypothetical protein
MRLVGLDMQTGEEKLSVPAGDLAYVTMAADAKALTGSSYNFLDDLLTINNPINGSTHRICTRFANDDGSKVAYEPVSGGAILSAKGGLPITCP